MRHDFEPGTTVEVIGDAHDSQRKTMWWPISVEIQNVPHERQFIRPEVDRRTLDMSQLLNIVKTFLKSDDGPTSVEYCVMMAFIFLVCFAAIGELGETTHELYSESLTEIEK